MYHRFFSAVVRLIHPNTFQSADNPLQIDRLPDDSRIELDYPVFQHTTREATNRLWMLLFAAALAAPIFTWITNILPFPIVTWILEDAILYICGVLIVFGVLMPRWGQLAIVAAVAVPPVVTVLRAEVPPLVVIIFMLVAAQLFLADRLATCNLYLKTAAPTSREQALAVRKLWRSRFLPFRLRAVKGGEFYYLAFLLVPLLSIAIVVTFTVANPVTDGPISLTHAVFLLLAAVAYVVPFPIEFLAALFYRRSRLGWYAQITATWRALLEWANYNQLNTRGPGVHRPPVGTCTVRCFLLVAYILSWSLLWSAAHTENAGLPGLLSTLVKSYKDMTDQFEELGIPNPMDREPEIPPLVLSPEDESFLRLLPSHEQEQLRSRLETEHRNQVLAERQKERDDKGIRTPSRMVFAFLKQVAVLFVHISIPITLVLSVSFFQLVALVGRPLAGLEAALGRNTRQRVYGNDNWSLLVERMQRSEDSVESHSILMGVNARDDTPVLVPRDVFREHAHILGDSGAGKTSIGLLPLISQLMRRGDCSIVFIDLKADDQSVFEALRHEALQATDYLKALPEDAAPANRNYRFRWFTPVIGRSSFAFNPLTQSALPKLAIDQQTDLIISSLGLHYGTDYGRAYFGDANFDILQYALRANPDVTCFSELEEILRGVGRFPLPEETKKRAGTHVRSIVSRLSHIRALNASAYQRTPQTVLDAAIDMDQVFTEPQAIYFALPPSAGVSNTERIARIALYSLLAAAQLHEGRRTQVFLVVDEFQRIVANNIELFLQQARSMDIGCILSNQSLSDLEKVDSNLISAVRTNTRYRQVFGAATVEDIRDLVETAGQTVRGLRSWKYRPGTFESTLADMSISESVATRFSTNDILLATDAPGRSIACVRRGQGYAQFGGMPLVMDSAHHITPDVYRERKKSAWPAPDACMVVAEQTDAALRTAGPIILESQDDGSPARPKSRKKRSSAASASQTVVVETEPEFDLDLEALLMEQEAEESAKRTRRKNRRKPTGPPPDLPPSESF